MTNKIAIIADIHGNSLALKAVLHDIKRQGVRNILNLGDTFYGPLFPKETYDLILQNNVISISGNSDRFLIENYKNPDFNPIINFTLNRLPQSALVWLEDLQSSMVYENMFLCHGNVLRDDIPLFETFDEGKVVLKKQSILETEVKTIAQNIILCAHSHIPRLLHLTKLNKTIINPGSVGLPAYDHDYPVNHSMESNSPFAKYCVIEFENHEIKSVHLANVDYDHISASNQAMMNGRPDWAYWLKYGKSQE